MMNRARTRIDVVLSNENAKPRVRRTAEYLRALIEAEDKRRGDITPGAEVVKIIRAEVDKQREVAELLELFEAGEASKDASRMADLMESFLVVQLPEANLHQLVRNIVGRLNLVGAGKKGMRAVMSELELREDIDNATAARVALKVLEESPEVRAAMLKLGLPTTR